MKNTAEGNFLADWVHFSLYRFYSSHSPTAVQLVLDAETVRMPSLPLSKGGVSGNAQGLFEVCVCPSGKLFLSKAGVISTCSENQEC